MSKDIAKEVQKSERPDFGITVSKTPVRPRSWPGVCEGPSENEREDIQERALETPTHDRLGEPSVSFGDTFWGPRAEERESSFTTEIYRYDYGETHDGPFSQRGSKLIEEDEEDLGDYYGEGRVLDSFGTPVERRGVTLHRQASGPPSNTTKRQQKDRGESLQKGSNQFGGPRFSAEHPTPRTPGAPKRMMHYQALTEPRGKWDLERRRPHRRAESALPYAERALEGRRDTRRAASAPRYMGEEYITGWGLDTITGSSDSSETDMDTAYRSEKRQRGTRAPRTPKDPIGPPHTKVRTYQKGDAYGWSDTMDPHMAALKTLGQGDSRCGETSGDQKREEPWYDPERKIWRANWYPRSDDDRMDPSGPLKDQDE